MRGSREKRDGARLWLHCMTGAVLAACIMGFPLIATRAAAQSAAPSYSVSYSFAGGTDGSLPAASLIADSSGILYGTTSDGGIVRNSCFGGCGVVFRLDPQSGAKGLYSFTGGSDGARPFASLVRDAADNLYGTTTGGGITGTSCSFRSYGCGVVFKLNPQGKETVLHTFGTVAADGAGPQAGLIQDASGNLYGTATYSSDGGNSCTTGYGCGVVFEIDAAGHYKVLHRFTGSADGANPQGGLVRDSAGNLYGTTMGGGNTSSSCPSASYGCGVVFKLDPHGNETVLYTFTGGADGSDPRAGLIRDAAGNLYGTTFLGGNGSSSCPNGSQGCGVVFKVDPLGNETVLHSFTGGADGAEPLAGLIRDAGGNLYGTTFIGGTIGTSCSITYGCGVVFKVDALGNETVVHSFAGGTDGDSPLGGLVVSHGIQYGTANRGGTYDGGVVFSIQR